MKVVAWDDDMLSGEGVSGADFEIYDPTSGVKRDRDIPAHAVISGNMPNPFNASTLIRFGIPADGPVDLGIYDVSGRLIAGVADGRYEAGYHEVGWTNAETARPGVYFLRLRTGSAEATRKIVIFR